MCLLSIYCFLLLILVLDAYLIFHLIFSLFFCDTTVPGEGKGVPPASLLSLKFSFPLNYSFVHIVIHVLYYAGHVADALQTTKPDVYITTDGGYKWRKVCHSHKYNKGNLT